MDDHVSLVAITVGSLLVPGLCACSSTPAPSGDAGPARAALQFDSSWSDDGFALVPDGDPAAAAVASRAVPVVGQEGTPQEPYPNLYRRAGLSLGAALYANFDTTIRVDSGSLISATLDMEDFPGLDDSNFIGCLDAFYSFSPRHRLDLSVYDVQREDSRTIFEEIQVGNVVIPAGEVDTSLETLIVKAAYRYNFVADARTAIGASLGLHTMGIDLALESPAFEVSESFRATAPLPVIGLHGEYALSERWKLPGSMELFQIDLGFARGLVGDNRLAIEHDLLDHVGLGLAFNGFSLEAEIEDSPLTADLEYAYQGVLLYLRAYL